MQRDDFEAIYNSYAEDVYRFLLHLCRDKQLAEELLQDTFLKAIENIDSFDGRCKLTSWLCQIGKNLYFDYLRKQKKHETEELTSEEVPDSNPDCLDRLILKETGAELMRIVHTLQDPYKEVFLLRVYGDMPFGEIAALFGRSEVWGRVTFLRAKEKVLEKYRLLQEKQ